MQRPRHHLPWRTSRSLPRVVAALAMLTASLTLLAPAQAAHAQGDTGSVMAITLDDLSPAVLPAKGAVTLSGTVTNTDTQTWSYLNLQAFASESPITTQQDLAAAAEQPADAYVGPRIQTIGTFAQIPALAPGETQSFSISVPRKELTPIPVGVPGVYWIGVHALGTDLTGYRPTNAIGRARTFIAQLPRRTSTVPVALAFQLRHLVERAGDGRLADASAWATDLAVGGSLSMAAAVATAADPRPINWIVDPAVVDAVSSLADGNPPRPLGVAQGSPTSSASPSAGAAATTTDPTQAMAKQWLTTISAGWRAAKLYALPYGDLDLDGATQHDPNQYPDLRKRSGTSILGLPAQPVVAPPDGRLAASTVANLPLDVTTVLSSQEVSGGPVATMAGHRLLISNAEAATGGPGPDDPLGSVAMRQRILAEAALQTLMKHPQPLVVVLPETFRPASPAVFFSGLDQPWLRLESLSSVSARPTTVAPDQLRTSDTPTVAAANFAEADALDATADRLNSILVEPDAVVAEMRDQAATAIGYAARSFPLRARQSAASANRFLHHQLALVSVSGPPSVTLSSDAGSFAVSVHNGLDVPIQVRLQASTDGLLQVTTPSKEQRVPPGGHDTAVLHASASRLGVHNVVVSVVDQDGQRIGTAYTLPVRAAQVSGVIWIIAGLGAALLFIAIVMRNVRRIRGRTA